MKSILKLSWILAVVLLFTACEKDGENVVIGTSEKGSIKASATTLPLSKNTQTDTVVKFTWTSSNFGKQIAVNNTLQFAVKGTNFATPKEVNIEANAMKIGYTGLALNALASSMGVEFSTPTEIEVRLKSEAAGTTKVAPIYTTPVVITVTTYPSTAYVFVPGDYQGWNPATADSLKSATGNGIYIGVINFGTNPNGTLQFKITPEKKWDVAYGSAGDGKVSTTAGDNLKAPTAFPYRITLNTNDNTIKMDKYSFGVIGSATPGGWGTDTDMKYDNGKDEWFVTLNLVAGELKFRLNDAWDVNYGGKNMVAAQNGDNIAIAAAGTYEVRFSAINLTYSVVKK